MESSTKEQLRRFFADLESAWTDGDPTVLKRFYGVPFIRSANGRCQVFEDDFEFQTALHRLLKLFKRHGFAKARLSRVEDDSIEGEPIHARVGWELLDEQGRHLVGFDVRYRVEPHGPHGWSITGIEEDDQIRALSERGWLQDDDDRIAMSVVPAERA